MSRRKRYPAHHTRSLARLPLPQSAPHEVAAVWGSRDYFVTLWRDQGFERLTINSTTFDHDTQRWADGLDWDTLMRLKDQAGYAHRWAVEVFPPDDEIVDDANMRHLWLLPEAPDYAWRTNT